MGIHETGHGLERTATKDRYSVVGTLGGGGMGQIYLARDELLGREVALKVLRAQHAENQQFVERFRREAKNAAALSHPNIVSVYDAGEGPDGVPYMAMEYVPGGTLGELIQREAPLDSLEAGGIALQVACALQEAHKRGVIHRDIKPLNIFLAEGAVAPGESSDPQGITQGVAPGGLPPGGVKVGDFGIARAAAETAMTETSLILGTVRYLSPEQATGGEVGPQSDLYSLGVVLYEMLTGEVPFDAENPIAIAMKHVSQTPVPPRDKNPGVPEGLQAVTLRLLAKDPEDRYADAGELVEDLKRVSRGQPPAHPVEDEILKNHQHPVWRRGAAVRRRSRVGGLLRTLAAVGILILGAALVLVGMGGGFTTLYENLNVQVAAQPVRGMQEVPEPSVIDAPVATALVPGVVGENEEEAEQALTETGFEVVKKYRESNDEAAGTVLSQDPRPDARAQRGSRVTITIAEAPSTAAVPNLTGLSPQEAEAVLSESGLALGQQSEAPSDTIPVGLILGQDIRAGAEVARGAEVGVTISLGPEPEVVVPELAPESVPAPAPTQGVQPLPQRDPQPQVPQTQQPQVQEPQVQQPQRIPPPASGAVPQTPGVMEQSVEDPEDPAMPSIADRVEPEQPDPVEPIEPEMPEIEMPDVPDGSSELSDTPAPGAASSQAPRR